MTSLLLSAERFAGGEPVLVAGLDGEGAAIAIAAARADSRGLEALHELGGDTVVLGLEPATADRLRLTAPRAAARLRSGLRLGTPVDAADCRGGWALADRVHTIRVASDPGARPDDLTVPGHVHTARIDGAGSGAPAVALELARVAGQPAAVVLSAVLDRFGRPVSGDDARRDARLRALSAAPVDELCGRAIARHGERDAVACALPTRLGAFRVLAATTGDGGEVTVTLVHGDPERIAQAPVHTHVACLLGDTFGSLLCDCHARLELAAREIVDGGAGMLIYVKPVLEDPFACPRGRDRHPGR